MSVYALVLAPIVFFSSLSFHGQRSLVRVTGLTSHCTSPGASAGADPGMERPMKAASGIERTAKEGIPIFDGTPEMLRYYREEAIQYMFTFETHKRYLAGPRLAKELIGVARTIVRKKNLQNPQWLANPQGVYALLEHLETAMERPSLVQASQLVSRFFFNLKRRRQESMTHWINRHSEALWEASRALKRVQEEFGAKASQDTSSRRTSTSTGVNPDRGLDYEPSRRPYRAPTETFDDHGRLPQEEDDDDATGQWSEASWSNWGWWQSGWNPKDWHQAEYEPPATWHTDEEDFLPDFLVGFLLLHRSGLDANERANILAAIRGEFSVAAVSKALREQWADEDLQRRDRRKEQAMWAEADAEDEEDAAMVDDIEAPDPDGDPDAFAAFQDEQETINEALEVIAQQKRTLRDARWRQHQVKMNRKFYPVKGRGDGGKGRSSTSRGKGKGQDSRMLKCLRCGGSHATQMCPQKSSSAQHAEEEAELAFVTFAAANDDFVRGQVDDNLVDEAPFLDAQASLSLRSTASLASVDALEAITRLNLEKGQDDKITVIPDLRPTFRFGNGERKECISSVHLRVDMADRTGKMQLHVHDTPEQPALISVRALSQLGAIIDFSTNECIFMKVNPHAVVQLDAAENEHILMPPASNLLEKASHRKTAFQGLAAEYQQGSTGLKKFIGLITQPAL